MSKIVTFVREVKAELEKVTWPKRDDLVGSVIIVCVLAVTVAVIIGLMDAGISTAIRWLMR